MQSRDFTVKVRRGSLQIAGVGYDQKEFWSEDYRLRWVTDTAFLWLFDLDPISWSRSNLSKSGVGHAKFPERIFGVNHIGYKEAIPFRGRRMESNLVV